MATNPADHSAAREEGPRIAFRVRLSAEGAAQAPSAADEEALAAFRRAAWLNPEEADYHYILGEALLRALRFTEAAVAFEEASWRGGRDAQYQLGLGVALHALRRDVEAASAFREAARLAPGEPRARGGLGAALVALGQRGEGIRELRQATLLAPEDADAHFNLGLALIASGQEEEALDPLRRSASLAPNDVLALAELGRALHALGRHGEAHTSFGKALHLDPRCLESEPRLQAAHEASSIATLKEGIRDDVAIPRSPWRWVLRPLVVVVERLPAFPTGFLAALTYVLLGLVTYATLRLVPPYWNHYTFKDEIAEIAHAPLRDDAEIRLRILETAGRHHLGRYVQDGDVTIDTRRTWRRITCRYSLPVALLPGFEPRLRFSLEVEEPVLIDGEEKIFF